MTNDSITECVGHAELCRAHQAWHVGPQALYREYPAVAVSPYFVENRGVQADLEGYPILAKDLHDMSTVVLPMLLLSLTIISVQ